MTLPPPLLRAAPAFLALATAAGLLWVFFRWFERANVYHPSRTFRGDPAWLRHPWRPVDLTTSDGLRLGAWYFEPPTNAPTPARVVLVCHGNGGNIGDRLDLYQQLLECGLGILAFDYRGYGTSEGHPTEPGTYLDAAAAVDWLLSQGHAEAAILVYGESLGGAIATETVVRYPALGGLVLQSTFTSIPALGAELFPWLPVRWLARIRYDTLSKLPSVRPPVLILHSREDSLIGFRHAEANATACSPAATLTILRGDHNDCVAESPDAFRQALRTWLAAHPLHGSTGRPGNR